MVANRKWFGPLLPGSDHLPHTYNREQQAFTKGEPEWGAHLANELERLVALHDASTIAAVIVEPMAGSTGVLPPPKGYLKRLRELCDKHGILLIFDEVITAFGRLGQPFAAERFGVVPDMITFAKGVTSGTIPMGGVMVRQPIYDAFMTRARPCDRALPRLYLHRPSDGRRRGPCHPRHLSRRRPVRARQRDRGRMGRRCHVARNHPLVEDIRTLGLVAGFDLRPVDGSPGLRAYQAMESGFHDHGIMLRISGDTIALSPPLIISRAQIDEIFSKRLPAVLDAIR